MSAHGVVVLAAGDSSRLGQSKQLLRHRGETLIHRAARIALETTPGDAVIVLGAQADSIFAQVADLPIRRVDCDDWPLGMAASLLTGIAALSAECDGALIVVCDQPALSTAHLTALIAAWHTNPQHAAASHYADHLGVPALLPREWFTDLRNLHGDLGAHDLLAQRRAEITVVANEALAIDIDRPVDLFWLES